jgi:chemotaxis protein histidine kinase CheA
MHIPPVALKRKNHRLLLCTAARKHDLLAKLIEAHEGKRIAVAVSGDAETLTVPETVIVLVDETPNDGNAETFDLLISFDLPAAPAQYMARLALAGDTALTLLDEADQAHLLAVETLLGRAIPQERPEGFAPEPPAAPKTKYASSAKERTPREPRTEKAPFKKEGKPAQNRKPKASGVSRYIGKDGKPHTEESLAAKKAWEEKRKKRDGKKPYDANKKPPYKGEKKPYESKGKPEAPAHGKNPSSSKPKRPMIRIKAEKLNPKTFKK